MKPGAVALWSLSMAGLLATPPGGRLAAQAPQAPVFKSGVELIAVDVNVVDRAGQPVTGLQPDQFEVTVDGKPRRVVSAEFIDYAPAAAAAATTPALSSRALQVEAGYSSNDEAAPSAAPGRLIVLAIDQGSFRRGSGRAAMEAARRFLDRLQPSDRVALIAFPSPGPVVAPTFDREVVRTALGRIVGSAEQLPVIDPSFSISEALDMDRGDSLVRQEVIDRECTPHGTSTPGAQEACVRRLDSLVPEAVQFIQGQATRSINGLHSTVEAMAGIDGHKTLVLISAGIVPGNASPHMDIRAEIRAVAASAGSANMSVYVLHVATSFLEAFSAEQRGMPASPFQDAALLASGLDQIAGYSAGTLFTVTAGADNVFERISREISAFYLLGIEPTPPDRDGRAHRIQVRVRIPNTTVRSRNEFVVPTAPAAPASPEEALRRAVRSGRVARDLPIRLATHTLQAQDGAALRVLISAEIGRGTTAPSDLRVGYAISDSAGRQVGSATEQKTLASTGAGPLASWPYMTVALLKPGSYTIRFAAVAPDGRVGSVERRFEARLTDGEGLRLSDLLLVDPARTPADALATIIDGRIRGASVGLYVEAYPARKRPVTAVSFDVAGEPDGAPVLSAQVKPVEQDSGRRWTASTDVDVRLLPPGDYFAVATVLDGATRLARISRPFTVEPLSEAAVATGIGPRAPIGFNATGSFVRKFAREDLLRPDIVAFFVGRMQAADGVAATEAVSQAAEDTRRAKFDTVLADLAGAGSDQLSVTFLRGLAAFAKGDLPAAADQFRSSLRASSEFLPAAFYLGACYAAGGRDREAAGAWQTSLITESEARVVYDVLSDALLRLQDAPAAIDILAEARGRWPDDDGFVPRLAAAYAIGNRRADAFRELAPYLDRHPGDAEALFLAMRLVYDAHAAGGTLLTSAEDAAAMARYAALYKAAGGASVQLVERWAQFVGQGGARQ